MEKTTVYLVRHGETEWNVTKRFQGHLDSALMPLGRNQALWLGESLSGTVIDAVYASSSARTMTTASLIAQGSGRDVRIQPCDEFKEMYLGVWEGLELEEAKCRNPLQFQRFWEEPDAFQVEGSETFRAVADRAMAKLNELLPMHAGQSILIVTHTVVVKVLMAYFEQREMNAIWGPPYIHPTCLSKIEIDQDIPRIIMHGDTSHFREESGEAS
ncbi:histidine phosphatase family protein [Paenibacillus xanthanilyticus]|uniref:Histidine phosphatase family protein n=1 Tax=Paenibacillus xanthanilyticus TaxID=1783531 RepID=A0ABV8K1S5_9BACL